MRLIQEVLNLKGRTAIVRVDFNVPIGLDGVVDKSEDWRIQKSLETINHLKNSGAKTILISHIGRDKKDSLKPVAKYLQNFLSIGFVSTWDEYEISGIVKNMNEGDIILLENLRQKDGEEENDQKFAQWLSSLADLYINEAFSVSHRLHASIISLPLYLPSYAGFWLQKEVSNLSKVLKDPKRPLLLILGGAKFETKLPLLKKFEKIADEILIGGALANNFFRTIGFNIGKSLQDKDALVSEFFNKENIKIPFDVVVKDGQKDIAKLENEDIIVDLGRETTNEWGNIIKNSKTVLWNGPLGLYEEGFDVASKKLLEIISTTDTFSVIGGGDTVKLVKDMGLEDKISFISTGGGAMLDYLTKGTLPGLSLLENIDDQKE